MKGYARLSIIIIIVVVVVVVVATWVPWYVRSHTSLSKHGNPMFPHLCPLNQNLARERTGRCVYCSGYILVVKNARRHICEPIVVVKRVEVMPVTSSLRS